jgi:hypothetical protein
MQTRKDFPLNEEETLISDQLATFWKEEMQIFFAIIPSDKPNPMIALRSASNLFADTITELFKDFPQAQKAGQTEVQNIVRRILGWTKLKGQVA